MYNWATLLVVLVLWLALVDATTVGLRGSQHDTSTSEPGEGAIPDAVSDEESVVPTTRHQSRASSGHSGWSLIMGLTDDEDYVRDVVEIVESKVEDICLLDIVICTAKGAPRGVHLTRVHGKINFALLKPPITELVVEDSVLSEGLSMDQLPPTLINVTFRRVRFAGGTTSISFSDPRRRMLHFTCADCNVVSADWTHAPHLESLDLSLNPRLPAESVCSLPQSLLSLNVSGCQTGIDAGRLQSCLPASLRVLDLAYNKIAGFLPCFVESNLQVLSLRSNSLTGSFCAALPPLLEVFDLRDNEVSGELGDMSEFWSLSSLLLGNNRVSTVKGWALLPRQLTQIDLSGNGLRTAPVFKDMPPSLQRLNLSRNGLAADISFSGLPDELTVLDLSYNEFTGTIDVQDFPDGIESVFVQHNRFSGNPQLVDLPLLMKRIVLHNNAFAYSLPREFDG